MKEQRIKFYLVETEYNLGSLSNKYFYNKNDSASWLSISNTSEFLGSRNK